MITDVVSSLGGVAALGVNRALGNVGVKLSVPIRRNPWIKTGGPWSGITVVGSRIGGFSFAFPTSKLRLPIAVFGNNPMMQQGGINLSMPLVATTPFSSS